MTQPDKWDDAAAKLVDEDEAWGDWDLSLDGVQKLVATALRQAFAEGERAGMERAAVIADATEDEWANQTASYWEGMRGRVEVPPPSLAIRRAAKETKA